jgi:hypothetical protein
MDQSYQFGPKSASPKQCVTLAMPPHQAEAFDGSGRPVHPDRDQEAAERGAHGGRLGSVKGQAQLCPVHPVLSHGEIVRIPLNADGLESLTDGCLDGGS